MKSFKEISFTLIFLSQFSLVRPNSDLALRFPDDFITNVLNLGLGLFRFQDLLRKNGSQTCFQNLQAIITAFQNGEKWAFQVFDSSAKFIVGVELPSSSAVCYRLQKSRKPFEMKFCYLEITGDFSDTSIPMGICLPQSCSEEMVNNFLQTLKEIIDAKVNVKLRCSYNKDPSFEVKGIMVICLALVLVVILATIYDFKYQQSNHLGILKKLDVNTKATESLLEDIKMRAAKGKSTDSMFIKILLCFSVITNGRQLFKLKYSQHEFPVINGLKALSILGVIMGHASMMSLSSDNLIGISTISELFLTNFELSFYFSLNVFFLISGLLTSYAYLTLTEKGRKVSWLQLLLYRFLRITPVFWFFLIVQWKSIEYLFPSRLNILHQINTLNCNENWWLSFLYLQNLVPVMKQCLGQGWYLANDMQLFIFSFPILAIMKRSSKYFLFICGTIMVTTMILTIIVCQQNQLEIYVRRQYNLENLQKSNLMVIADKIYSQPWYRCNAYLQGMICGFVLFKTKSKKKLTKTQVTLFWGAALLLCVPILFILNKVQLSPILTAMFINFKGTFWSIGLSLIIFLCCNGYGNVASIILSWKIWAPLNRLTLSILVSHLMVLQWIEYEKDIIYHTHHPAMILLFLIAIKFSILFGIILYLVVEKPFSRIISLLLK